MNECFRFGRRRTFRFALRLKVRVGPWCSLVVVVRWVFVVRVGGVVVVVCFIGGGLGLFVVVDVVLLFLFVVQGFVMVLVGLGVFVGVVGGGALVLGVVFVGFLVFFVFVGAVGGDGGDVVGQFCRDKGNWAEGRRVGRTVRAAACRGLGVDLHRWRVVFGLVCYCFRSGLRVKIGVFTGFVRMPGRSVWWWQGHFHCSCDPLQGLFQLPDDSFWWRQAAGLVPGACPACVCLVGGGRLGHRLLCCRCWCTNAFAGEWLVALSVVGVAWVVVPCFVPVACCCCGPVVLRSHRLFRPGHLLCWVCSLLACWGIGVATP